MIRQFLSEVDWGTLDYLILDTPPGTSDEHLSATSYLKGAGITGAIIITTPPQVALLDVRKEIDFCRKVNIPILGVVENMSIFVCPKCKVRLIIKFGDSTKRKYEHIINGKFYIQSTAEIFPASTGGAQTMSKELNVEFLGSIPLDPFLARCCDEGKNFLTEMSDSPTVSALNKICKRKTLIYIITSFFTRYKKIMICMIFQVLLKNVKKKRRIVLIIPCKICKYIFV